MLALWIIGMVLLAGAICLGIFLAFWGCVSLGIFVEDFFSHHDHNMLHHS
jgi:hypothetical protein